MNARWFVEQFALASVAAVVAFATCPVLPFGESIELDGLFGVSFALPACIAWGLILYTALVFSLTFYTRRTRRLEAAEVGIVLDPSDSAEYGRMFDGFENCDFYAFNAPFRVEGEPGDRIFEDAVEMHRRRYDQGVRAKYLFFDPESHERAVQFFQHLDERLDGGVGDFIQVRRVAADDPPGFTFFAGKRPSQVARMAPQVLRRGMLTESVIMYPEELNETGYPEAVVVIDGAPDLYRSLVTKFRRWWNQGVQA